MKIGYIQEIDLTLNGSNLEKHHLLGEFQAEEIGFTQRCFYILLTMKKS